MLHSFLLKLRTLFTQRRHRQQLADELAFHQAMLEDRFADEGLSPEEAAKAARRRLGSSSRWQERVAELWQWAWLENLARDFSYATRLLRRSPGFTSVAVITLALGIGANTAIFSVFDAFLLRQLPVPHPEQIVFLSQKNPANSGFNTMSAPLYSSLHALRGVFASTWAYHPTALDVRANSGTREVAGMFVSGSFFPSMQVPAALGRTLLPRDDVPGGGASGYAAVLSNAYWREHFNASKSVLGQHLRIADGVFTIVGVMPAGFRSPDVLSDPRIFVPVQSEPVVDAPYDVLDYGVRTFWLIVGARLRPDAPLAQANAQLSAESAAIFKRTSAPAGWADSQMHAPSYMVAAIGSHGFSFMRNLLTKPLNVLFTLCGALLVLACLNLAGLLLARSAAREHELATRLSIGASRGRLLQQLLVETCILSALGAALGLAVTPLIAHGLCSMLFDPTQSLDIGFQPRMFLFAALIAAGSTLLSGLLPAWRVTSTAIHETVKNNQIARPRRALRSVLPRALLVTQVALTLILLAGAGLLSTSLFRLENSGLGFDPKGLVTIPLNPDPQPLKGPALLQLYRQIGGALSHQPGVEKVSYTSIVPFSGSMMMVGDNDAVGKSVAVDASVVSPAYFASMRIPLLAGRDFIWTDTTRDGQKIILNQTAAHLLLGIPVGEEVRALGRFLGKNNKQKQEIIGVVADSKYNDLTQPAPSQIFEPITQDDFPKPSYTLIIRYQGSPVPLAAAARSIVARLSPRMPAPLLTPMNTEIDRSIASERMLAWISVFFAVCALLVTGIGLYGTLAYTTARRTNEIGIRMALGAQRAQVVRLVVWENLLICLTGAVGGLIAALFAARLLATLLFGVSAHNPWVLLGACLLLLTAGGLASLLPAIHAAHIDPNAAIRTE
jgi:predicted permease